MANTFSLILVLVTLVTGVIWALDKYRWQAQRKAKTQASTTEQTSTQTAPQPQASWLVENAVSMFPVLFVVLVLRSFLYEPFQIPSGSMMPTLLIGDFILVEKYAYGIKDPVWRNELIATGKPQRGDVAVFKYPLDPRIDYIKRVVGLPGDVVSYRNKQLCIQTPEQTQCQVVALSKMAESEFIQNRVPLLQLDEALTPRGHQILVHPQRSDDVRQYQPRPMVNEWVVPEGHYFMLGDNRDNSADSRFWGFVPEANLVGKAVAIWISFEFEREADSWLPSWIPTNVRFNRIGSIH